MHVVILAGGSGTRLWPASHATKPKPFIKVGGKTLMEITLKRALTIPGVHSIITVTSESNVAYVQKEYSLLKGTEQIGNTQLEILIEPSNQDTAAAIASAALLVQEKYNANETLLILPSDHIIQNTDSFSNSITKAKEICEREDKIITFGITPHYPETSYGYIKTKGTEVISFIEKPTYSNAIKYINKNNYSWNSGILLCKSGTLIDELKKHCSTLFSFVYKSFKYSLSSFNNLCIQTILNPKSWALISAKSIDYELLEKSKKLALVSCDMDWVDVGNWESMIKQNNDVQDSYGNRVRGNVYLHESQNCYIENSSNKKMAVVGASNLAIIEMDNGTLIIDRSKVKDPKIKEFMLRLNKLN